MEKRELKVGQRVQAGFLVVECVASGNCNGCIGENSDCDITGDVFGDCGEASRSDGVGVIFKIVEDADSLDDLAQAQRAYHAAEDQIIAANPAMTDAELENLSDSYKWMRTQLPDGCPEFAEIMMRTYGEDCPSDALAGALAVVWQNKAPKGVRLRSVGIDKVGNALRFCISGETDTAGVRTLCEHCTQTLDLECGK